MSAAALLHDLGHVPFGHTLEDEFTGIYPRHDGLGGPRLYEMLFSESSGLARVFADTIGPWLQKLSNIEIRQLIYVILSWKDDIDTASGFETVVKRAKAKAAGDQEKTHRLESLENWYISLRGNNLFHPFMSDVVGNTICADLLDYLPRDRQHLGMEPRLHTRLQRYLTIREGTLYPNEGYRVSIMVTRKGRGGQRRDVATAVLDIMRERYEMAERVYYHHKKASASAMLVKLVELVGPVKKPRDDAKVYPAPWSNGLKRAEVPHMVHLSDQELIDYLGTAALPDSASEILQRQLHAGLRYKRTGIYRTLLVVDVAMADASSHSISYLTKELRGDDSSPSNEGRLKLERELESIAGAESGQVLIYCPSPRMQSKVVDARLEIKEGRVLPLRVQTDSFAYRGDLEVLQRYYDELWRAYLFVSPPLFKDKLKCRLIVETFSNHFGIPLEVAHRKVRAHDFSTVLPSAAIGLEAVQRFLEGLPIDDVPTQTILAFLDQVSKDDLVHRLVGSGADPSQRLSVLFQIAALKTAALEPARKFKKADVIRIEKYCESLQAGEKPYQVAAREGRSCDVCAQSDRGSVVRIHRPGPCLTMKRRLTRSEKYFVDRFNAATLNGAIERAAFEERGVSKRSLRPPIDVFEIAKARCMEVKEDLVGECCGEGLLLPCRSGYLVRLRASSTKSRKRFSLAHELGHTLFYKDEGRGPRHQIGVLDRSEQSAEERICNAFASALLMPADLVRDKIVDLPTAAPSTALCKLDSTARFFGVSVLALLHRLRAIQLHVPPYMLVCMSKRPNPATGNDATLRVDAAVPIGTWSNMYIWRNRSAHSVGLLHATTLYGEWTAMYGSSPAKGSFGIDPKTGSIATNCISSDSEENLLLSRVVNGRWRNEPVRVFSSQRLYAWTDAFENSRYIVAAIALAHVT